MYETELSLLCLHCYVQAVKDGSSYQSLHHTATCSADLSPATKPLAHLCLGQPAQMLSQNTQHRSTCHSHTSHTKLGHVNAASTSGTACAQGSATCTTNTLAVPPLCRLPRSISFTRTSIGCPTAPAQGSDQVVCDVQAAAGDIQQAGNDSRHV